VTMTVNTGSPASCPVREYTRGIAEIPGSPGRCCAVLERCAGSTGALLRSRDFGDTWRNSFPRDPGSTPVLHRNQPFRS